MKSRLWAFGILLSVGAIVFMAALPASAKDVSGDQSGTWTLANSPYVVTGWVTIPVGQTLTIEPGVIAKFNQYLGMTVLGILNARGTSASNITFTSNGTQAKNWWNSIQFRGGSGTMDYCKVMYAGYYEGAGIGLWGNSSPTISNCEISNISDCGIRVYETAKPTLTGNTISYCSGWAVYVTTWKAMPTFQNNKFIGNAHFGVRADGADVAANQKLTLTIPGDGIPYSVGWITINQGATLTLPAGLIMKFDQYQGMAVYGTLSAVGTASNPIIFTTATDDSVGGDTNGDGAATAPGAGYWNSIQFRDGSGTMDYCKVMYAGYYDGAGIGLWGNSSPTISNCEISIISGTGVRLYNTSRPVLSNNTISNCSEWPVIIGNWGAMPTFQNNKYSGNKRVGIRHNDPSVPANQQVAWNHPGVPYSIAGWVTVNLGATLTLPAGLIVKFEPYQGMTVLGTLTASGAPSNPIVFTTMTDSSAGGDTNGDGGAAKPDVGYWNSLQFQGGSGIMAYCKVKYAGYYEGAGIGFWGNSSPPISNCEISYIQGSGIRIYNTAKPTLTNNVISNCTEWPVIIGNWSAMPTFQNNTYTGNKRVGLRHNDPSVPVNQQVTWNHPGLPYSVNGWVAIGAGATLTIPPGLIVKFEQYQGMTVSGTLTAKGTASNPIVFTTLTDDASGGDTNGDGASTTPAPDYWNSIQFNNSTGTLDYCKIMYAGYYEGEGIGCWGNSSPTISNSEISNIRDSGIKVYNQANPVISPNNIIEKCSDYGVRNYGSVTVNARNNWWGDASGPLHATLNPSGKGLKVSDKVDFSPYLRTKPGGATVTYEADVAPRPNGSGDVTATDWVQVGRFIAGLDVPAAGSEYQRADCAPRINSQGAKVLGDGRLTVIDWVQAGRYAAGLDALEPAGGPTAPVSSGVTQSSATDAVLGGSYERQQPVLGSANTRVVSSRFNNGINTLTVEIEAQGTENAVAFSLGFNPKALRFVNVTLDGGASGAALVLNNEHVGGGFIGIILALPPGFAFAPGRQKIMQIQLADTGDVSQVFAPLTFVDFPVQRELSDVNGNGLPVIFSESEKSDHRQDRR